MDEQKPCEATPSGDLYRDLMDPRIAKSEREWFASRKIAELEAENQQLKNALFFAKHENSIKDDVVAADASAGLALEAEKAQKDMCIDDLKRQLAELETENKRIRNNCAKLLAEVDSEKNRVLNRTVDRMAKVIEQRDRLKGALTRLASMEAFGVSFSIRDNTADKELLARINYAQLVIASLDTTEKD